MHRSDIITTQKRIGRERGHREWACTKTIGTVDFGIGLSGWAQVITPHVLGLTVFGALVLRIHDSQSVCERTTIDGIQSAKDCLTVPVLARFMNEY